MKKRGAEKEEKKSAKKRRGFLRLFRWGTLLPVVLLLAVGVALFITSSDDLRALSYGTGAVLCFLALLFFVGAFLGGAGVLQIVCGTALVALAVWLFVQPEEAGNALYYVLTGVVLLRALVGLFYALFAKRKESRLWQIAMAGSLLLLVCAVVCLFLPMLHLKTQNVLIGILCCMDALFELIALFHRISSKGGKEEEKRKKGEKASDDGKQNVPEEAPEENGVPHEGESATEKKKGLFRRRKNRRNER